jgi:hypothetical protein
LKSLIFPGFSLKKQTEKGIGARFSPAHLFCSLIDRSSLSAFENLKKFSNIPFNRYNFMLKNFYKISNKAFHPTRHTAGR